VTEGQTHCFRLPRTAKTIRLVSRSAVPAQVRDDSDDHRRLGIAVSRIVLDGAPLPLTDARLESGWHDTEHDGAGTAWRWTNGDAGLAVAGGHRLEIDVVMAERYWLHAPLASVATGRRAIS
jgi:hypothetical protein